MSNTNNSQTKKMTKEEALKLLSQKRKEAFDGFLTENKISKKDVFKAMKKHFKKNATAIAEKFVNIAPNNDWGLLIEDQEKIKEYLLTEVIKVKNWEFLSVSPISTEIENKSYADKMSGGNSEFSTSPSEEELNGENDEEKNDENEFMVVTLNNLSLISKVVDAGDCFTCNILFDSNNNIKHVSTVLDS